MYGKKLGDNSKAIEQTQKNKNIESQLNKYLITQEDKMDEEYNEKPKKDKKEKNYEEELISGINLQKLQQKYQPDRIPIDLSTLIAENREIYH